MDKAEIEKNRLDLSYKRNLQFMNAILMIGGGSLVAYFASFILNPNKIYEYTFIISIIITFIYIFYRQVDNNLEIISKKIKKLNIISS